jgi:hypothetical protein
MRNILESAALAGQKIPQICNSSCKQQSTSDRCWTRADFRFWSNSEVELADSDFRFTPEKQTSGGRAGTSVQCQTRT